MIIVHVVAPGLTGGLEGVVATLASGHQARGHHVHVVAVIDRPLEEYGMLTALREAGVVVHPVVVAPRAYRTERACVEGILRRVAPDVVHTHGYRADLLDAPVARRLGLPTVTTVHGFTGGDWKNRLYEMLQRFAFRRFDVVIAVSRPQVEVLVRAGVRSDNIQLVRNAWTERAHALSRGAARHVLGVRDDQFHIGWVGRLSEEKDPFTFLRALQAGVGSNVVASIIGDGPAHGEVEALVDRAGLKGVVRLHGILPDAVRLFPAFDAFVLSSRTEGTPLVLFEAMAAGVPIVATDVGGVPDVIGGGVAHLVSPSDPAALAEAIAKVRADPDRATARASHARTRLSEFSVPPWLGRHEELYTAARHAAMVGSAA